MYEIVTCEVSGSKADISIKVADKDMSLANQIEALQSASARTFVLSEASKKGIHGSPGISASVTFVPYTKEGQNLEEVYNRKDPDAHKYPIAYYVGSFKVQAKV